MRARAAAIRQSYQRQMDALHMQVCAMDAGPRLGSAWPCPPNPFLQPWASAPATAPQVCLTLPGCLGV